jgi:membrane protein DedA with SNARE-associated domain
VRGPVGPFVVLTTIGCALWAVAFVLIGLFSGTAWGTVSSVLGKVLLGAGIVLAAWFAYRATHRDRSQSA